MSPENFCYWLQGYFEISCKDRPGLTEQQRSIIEEHLKLVFKKETQNQTNKPSWVPPSWQYQDVKVTYLTEHLPSC